MKFQFNGKTVDLGQVGKGLTKAVDQQIATGLDTFWTAKIAGIKKRCATLSCPDHGLLTNVTVTPKSRDMQLTEIIGGRQFNITACCNKGVAIVKAEVEKLF
ncbi:MAG: hypothetical protein JSS65_02825 [Armatimonadetes bacterium]|nr:hypothetical protein [Armatimonadota bacterium]